MKSSIRFPKPHLKDSQAASPYPDFNVSFTHKYPSLVHSAKEPSIGAQLQHWLSVLDFLL